MTTAKTALMMTGRLKTLILSVKSWFLNYFELISKESHDLVAEVFGMNITYFLRILENATIAAVETIATITKLPYSSPNILKNINVLWKESNSFIDICLWEVSTYNVDIRFSNSYRTVYFWKFKNSSIFGDK